MSEAPCKIGDRIRLIEMTDDPCPIPAGTTGTVTGIHPWRNWAGGKTEFQINVKWDIPRTLAMVWPQDRFEVIGCV